MTILIPVLILTLLIGIAAASLVFARTRFAPATDELLADINRLLPQTQCAQCGYPGCKPYAQAVLEGEAINRCPPGGVATIEALSALLGRPAVPLDEECGQESPRRVAVIREDECIGCTLCIQACPVDAIVGAPQLMHTVIEAACTGCDLCLPPCPVDCIDLVETAPNLIQTSFPAFTTPCINCGECADACPRDLQPQLLHWYREDLSRGNQLNLNSCIECRRCDNVCPSEIPLTHTFHVMKNRQREQQAADAAAEIAAERFEIHEARLIASTSQVKARPDPLDRKKLLNALKEAP